jgi:hypothetical protein
VLGLISAVLLYKKLASSFGIRKSNDPQKTAFRARYVILFAGLAAITLQGPNWLQSFVLGAGSAFMAILLFMGTIWAYRQRDDWRNQSPEDETAAWTREE